MDGSFLTADSVIELICASRLPRNYGSNAATGADHSRSSQVNACFIPIDMYILYQPCRGTFQKHHRILWSRKSSCFAPGVI